MQVESTKGAVEDEAGGTPGAPPVADITAQLLRKRLREGATAAADDPPPPVAPPRANPGPDPSLVPSPAPSLALPGAGLMGPPAPHYGTADHPPSLFTATGRHLSAGALGHAPPAPVGASSGSGRNSGSGLGSGSGWESVSGAGTGADTGTGTGTNTGSGTATGSGSGGAAGAGGGMVAGAAGAAGSGQQGPWPGTAALTGAARVREAERGMSQGSASVRSKLRKLHQMRYATVHMPPMRC